MRIPALLQFHTITAEKQIKVEKMCKNYLFIVYKSSKTVIHYRTENIQFDK